MQQTRVMIMAAGEGKRMKSSLAKVLHQVHGRPMIDWVLDAARTADPHPVVIVGHGREQLTGRLAGVDIAVQQEQKGTGHAVMMARDFIPSQGYVVVMAGDMPLLKGETIARLVEAARQEGAKACVLTAVLPDATGYGRVIRDEAGRVCCIVEHRDASEQQRQVREINTSVYCFDAQSLAWGLERLDNHNDQKEYYLTDVIGLLVKQGEKVTAMVADAEESAGVNDRVQLAQAGCVMGLRIAREHMLRGVELVDPERTYIEKDVEIGRDTLIYPDNYLQAGTVIGEGCVLYPGNRISQTRMGDGCRAEASVMEQAQVGAGCQIGPFAYLRPGTQVGPGCRIGDFVEIKNANIGHDTKVSHLSYVGDADVGSHVNVGCGTVFVNYDGQRKQRSQVGDGAFIGCNSNLVAPVTVGEGAYTAAGSTITEDVPDGALAIARSRQENKPGWVQKRRKQ